MLKKLNGVTLNPVEMFSFCHLIGNPTRRRGFLPRMQLSMGKAQVGWGGGICQMANMIHWLVLHSPLEVLERSSHSFDPFPDKDRRVPFGTGYAIFYNYVDLRFINHTNYSFKFNFKITESKLWGELFSDNLIAETYKIQERNHKFIKKEETFYRQNEIWRRVCNRKNGQHLRDEFLKENYVKVMYTPEDCDPC